MTAAREDVPLTVRQIAERAQLTPRAVKLRLRSVLRRRGQRRWLSATAAECRQVLGDDFGRLPPPEARVDALEAKVRELRRDLNASLARQREFQAKAHAWFTRLESRLEAAERRAAGAA